MEYQKRVPVAIGTTITDMAVDFINQNNPEHVSKSWKVVYCATCKGSTKLRSHGMWLNLIAESSNSTQLPASVQCTPTYCTLEPDSNWVAAGLRNIFTKSITIPSHVIVGQLQQATIQKAQAPGHQDKQGFPGGKEGPWILDQLDLEGLNAWTEDQQQADKELLVASSDVFSEHDSDLGKYNILKHSVVY